MNSASALSRLTIAEAAPLIEKRQLSPVELTQACIARTEAVDGELKAFITPTFETAMADAQMAADQIAAGNYRGPLHGIPIALKDLFETAGVLTTAASPLRETSVPAEDAEVVRRLKAAGAVSLGKLNMHEWALGTTNVNAYFPTARNPWDRTRITGGSSGGSAAAVAAAMALGTLGSDTGGSVRIPASLCGITGLKPTYGRISVRGVLPLAWSLDHVGPMARSAADCALLLQAIAGYDDADPLSADVPAPDYAAYLDRGIEGLRIGVPSRFFFDKDVVDAEVLAAVDAAARVFETLGATVVEVEMDELVPATDLTAFFAEAVAYHREALDQTPETFGPSLRWRLEASARISGTEYADARLRQREAKRKLRAVFEQVDLLLTPTAVVAAGLIPSDADEPPFRELNGYPSALLGRNTRTFNITGVPAVSLPCGFTASGLPIGMQLVGSWWAEGTVLRAAHAYQQTTDWHRSFPDL
jgi:aspartyl-tRNA(Asn)/glutamyl-tRNA(Gln) amidotransferase subunit A